jgi:hypothetical protein
MKVTESLEAAPGAVVVHGLEPNEMALGGPQLVAEEHRAARVAEVVVRRKSNTGRLPAPEADALEHGE